MTEKVVKGSPDIILRALKSAWELEFNPKEIAEATPQDCCLSLLSYWNQTAGHNLLGRKTEGKSGQELY